MRSGPAMTERGLQAFGPRDSVLVFGLGYSGTAIAEAARLAGFQVTGTTRAGLDGSVRFNAAETASPIRDPSTNHPHRAKRAIRCWLAMRTAIAAAPRCAGSAICPAPWSTATGAAAGWMRTRRWRRRSRAGNAGSTRRTTGHALPTGVRWTFSAWPASTVPDDRRSTTCGPAGHGGCIKPGHQFGRIHRDDIARAVRRRHAAGPAARAARAQSGGRRTVRKRRGGDGGGALLGVAATAGNRLRGRAADDEPDGPQLLGGEPQGRQRQDARRRWGSTWLLSDLPRGPTRHPAPRSVGRPSAVAAPGPAGRDSRWSPSFTSVTRTSALVRPVRRSAAPVPKARPDRPGRAAAAPDSRIAIGAASTRWLRAVLDQRSG